jgi:hypothetical protein
MMKAVQTIVFAMVLAWAVPATAKDLTAGELRRLFPGSYSVNIFGSFILKVNMRGNGDIVGYAKGKRDTGRWSIEGSRLCIAWKTWTRGSKGCSALRREDGLVKGRGFSFKA